MKPLGDHIPKFMDKMGINPADTPPGNTPPGSTTNGDNSPCAICGKQDKFCNGLGFYDLDVPPGHPDFSKMFRCPNNPVETDNTRKETLRRLSNLDAFADKSFENFVLNNTGMSATQFSSLNEAFKLAQAFAENPNQSWVVLHGGYGCGKTHLAAAIGNQCLSRGENVLFITAPDLLDHLRRTFGAGSGETYDQTFERVRQADVLILDDLGVENPSPWAQEKLFQLLNHRYNNRLPTVITTNAELELLDARLRSRMMDTSFVHRVGITAPDYRHGHSIGNSELSELGAYAAYTFTNFDVHTGATADEIQILQQAGQIAHHYARHLDGWLAIFGPSGTGKTHLAAAIANMQQERGLSSNEIVFVDVADLLYYLRSTFSPNSPVSFDTQFNRVKGARLLIMDDLGMVDHSKAWVKEKLLQIIKYRYVRTLPTIITTIQYPDELDPQIRTRLTDSRLCKRIRTEVRPYVDRIQQRPGR